ncbi:MAG: sulfite exporter TauE/SafE family protein [Gammaproteobacteria bacterium]|nr:sulfite exporter TauE/SafE family protein [Gammaproteobacteria bacterium]
MELATLLPLIPVGLLVGILIGCIGIGGVLLVPSLVYVGGMDVHIAIASCMFSYLFSGTIGAIEFAKRRSIRWSMCGWLFAGAMPGAYLGALGLPLIPGIVLELLVTCLILFVGVYALREDRAQGSQSIELSNIRLVAIGLLTGIGSALSGTGGPLLLVPILVWLHVPVLTAVGLSQVVQLPVAALASVGNFMHGSIDFAVGAGVAVLLMIGVALGARLAHNVSAATLKRMVAVALLAVGALLLARFGYQSLWIGVR